MKLIKLRATACVFVTVNTLSEFDSEFMVKYLTSHLEFKTVLSWSHNLQSTECLSERRRGRGRGGGGVHAAATPRETLRTRKQEIKWRTASRVFVALRVAVAVRV